MLGRYRNGAVSYEPGQVIDVTEALGELLQRDSPGTFAPDGPVVVVAGEQLASGIAAPDRRARGGRTR